MKRTHRSYRMSGRDHLARAKALLAATDDASLVYVVLELRMAVECHVYATAETYADELPRKPLSKWQPPALLKELLRIDPRAATTGTLSFARETEPGVAGDKWVQLGTIKRMTLREVSEAYHSLGHFLHIETVVDRADGKIRDFAKLRDKCGALAERLTDIYAMTLHHLKMGETATLACFVCEKPIKRRLDGLQTGERLTTECGDDCFATYDVEKQPDGKSYWHARFDEVPCAHDGCTGTVQIWERHLKAGNSFRCDVCEKGSELVFGIQPEKTPATSSDENQ